MNAIRAATVVDGNWRFRHDRDVGITGIVGAQMNDQALSELDESQARDQSEGQTRRSRTERVSLACLKLRSHVSGRKVGDFDDYMAFQDREVRSYGPTDRNDFAAKLFVSVGPPRHPPWVALFPGLLDDAASVPMIGSAAAVLVIRIPGRPRYFALTFGTGGRYLMKDDAWERAYGLRTALNLIYPKGTSSPSGGRLIGVDAKRRAGETVRSRHQSNRAASLDSFQVDPARDVLNAATGRPVNSEDWGYRVSGSDALHFSVRWQFERLGELCRAIETAHDRTDYRQGFEWLDHYQPVLDPDLLEKIEAEVVRTVRNIRSKAFDLGPPEILDWSRVDGFQFQFDTRQGVRRPILRLGDLISHMRHRGELEKLDVEYLREHRIKAVDSDGQQSYSWSIWRCLEGQVQVAGDTFVLDEGEVYHVDENYLSELNNYLAAVPISHLALPEAERGVREDQYNRAAVAASTDNRVLLDKALIRAPEHSDPIELCDILTSSRCLVHVKRELGSSQLSHLFAQGAVSAELVQGDRVFCKEAQKVVDRAASTRERFRFFYPKTLAVSKFEIVYAIIADWRGRPLSKALPFFSKVNLRATRLRLLSRGFKMSVRPVSYRT